MNDKTIGRLVNVLAAQQVLITSLLSSVQQLGLSLEQGQRTLEASGRFAESYRNRLMELLMDAQMSEEQEKQMWNDLGLGDLWGPSPKPDDTP
jgi:hypothetical protein